MNKPYYDVASKTIHNCKKGSFAYFHELGHKNQFSYSLITRLDRRFYTNRVFYAIWNQALEIDANLYAISKWIRYKLNK